MPNLPNDNWSHWISALLVNVSPNEQREAQETNAITQAKKLLAAIDQGGIPTNPIHINKIARALGLDVLPSAPMHETIARIRLTIDNP